jgi:hypothetical protein
MYQLPEQKPKNPEIINRNAEHVPLFALDIESGRNKNFKKVWKNTI